MLDFVTSKIILGWVRFASCRVTLTSKNIRSRVRLGFESANFKYFQVSDHLGLSLISLTFQKLDRIRFESEWVERVLWVRTDFATSSFAKHDAN